MGAYRLANKQVLRKLSEFEFERNTEIICKIIGKLCLIVAHDSDILFVKL